MVVRRRTLRPQGVAGQPLLYLLNLKLESVHEDAGRWTWSTLIQNGQEARGLEPAAAGLAEDVRAWCFDQVAVEDTVDSFGCEGRCAGSPARHGGRPDGAAPW